MPTQTILFDINETVLDLRILKPKFRQYLGDESHMSTLFRCYCIHPPFA